MGAERSARSSLEAQVSSLHAQIASRSLEIASLKATIEEQDRNAREMMSVAAPAPAPAATSSSFTERLRRLSGSSSAGTSPAGSPTFQRSGSPSGQRKRRGSFFGASVIGTIQAVAHDQPREMGEAENDVAKVLGSSAEPRHGVCA